MQRVTRPSAAASLPAPPASPGAPGYFTSGNPVSGQAATVPGYEWFNAVQEELAAVATVLGAPLNAGSTTQVLQAIEGLIAQTAGSGAADTGVANAYAIAVTPAPRCRRHWQRLPPFARRRGRPAGARCRRPAPAARSSR